MGKRRKTIVRKVARIVRVAAAAARTANPDNKCCIFSFMVISHFHCFHLGSDEEELNALLGVAGRRRGRRLKTLNIKSNHCRVTIDSRYSTGSKNKSRGGIRLSLRSKVCHLSSSLFESLSVIDPFLRKGQLISVYK